MTVVYYAVEGETDVPIAEKLIHLVGLLPYQIRAAGGKSKLDARIPELNRSGAALNWLILRDLDHDSPCASALIDRILGGRRLSPRVSLRIPVRAVESWILADVEGFAAEFGVTKQRLPGRPDDLDDPKRHLIDVCRHSTQQAVRNAMVPRSGSGRKVGPEYVSRITMFARRVWNAERAARRSPSLERTVASLRRLVTNEIW